APIEALVAKVDARKFAGQCAHDNPLVLVCTPQPPASSRTCNIGLGPYRFKGSECHTRLGLMSNLASIGPLSRYG
ncbi:hypothetical protein CCR95_05885, partial [Thiocystis minor]|nr:hypothetical protein [Thiocystis minor]